MERKLRIDRLKQAMKSGGFENQTQLAKAIGTTQGTISKILKGSTTDSRVLPRLADYLGVSLSWLFGTSDDPEVQPRGYYEDVASDMNAKLIKEIDLKYSMGAGAFIDDVYHQQVPVPWNWLFPLIKGTFDDLFITYPVGDSMQPTISEGDVVIVDRAQKRIDEQDRIWCVTYGELGMIKRIRQLNDGGVMVISDNPAVPPFTAYDDELHVIGRVIWCGRRM